MNTLTPRTWLILISFAWLLGVALVQPWGEFPLNDDWVYAQPVKSLVEQGRFEIPQGWSASTMVSVVAWGTLFCLPFGFSFAALHLSMIVAGLAGILLTYKFVRENSDCEAPALWAAAVVAANPIYLNLSTTFMTDIFFYAVLILSAILSLRVIRHDRTRDYVLLLLTLTVAIFTRQFALLLAASFAAAYFLSKPFSWRTLFRAALPVMFVAGALVLHQYVLYPLFGFPDLRSLYSENLTGRFLEPLLKLAYHGASALASGLIYPGLFVLPFLFFVHSRTLVLPVLNLAPRIWVPVIAVFSAAAIWIADNRMPLILNILVDFGTGPLNLRSETFDMPHIAQAPILFWDLITIVGLVSGCMLSVLTLNTVLRFRTTTVKPLPEKHWILLFTILFAILYLTLVSIIGFFDRYYLILIPFIAVIFAIITEKQPVHKLRIAAAVCVTATTFLFSVCAAHDYHSWNRACWSALDYVTQDLRVPPERIDGGYEFNGSKLYQRGYHSPEGKSWWWVVDDEYVVNVENLKNYKEVYRVHFNTWLPWTFQNHAIVQQRITH